jgi:hypothetical protein
MGGAARVDHLGLLEVVLSEASGEAQNANAHDGEAK